MRRSNSSGRPVQKRMHGRIEAERLRLLWNVVNLSVCDEDDARHAIRRNVAERHVDVAEKVCTTAARITRARGRHVFHVQIGDATELLFQFSPDRRRLLRPLVDRLARAFVQNNKRDIREPLAIFLAQSRIGEGCNHRGQRQRPQGAATAPPQQQKYTQNCREPPRRPTARAPVSKAQNRSTIHGCALIARAVRGGPAHAPDRLCNCR